MRVVYPDQHEGMKIDSPSIVWMQANFRLEASICP